MGEQLRVASCELRVTGNSQHPLTKRNAFSLHTPHFALRMLILCLLILVSACGSQEQEFNGITYKPPIAAPEISGVNWDGTPFKIGDLKGNVALLFFGYTNCPDVCPLTMAKLASVYTEVGELATDVRVVMISTDPERDTPEILANYVKLFQPTFYAIQPNLADLEALMKAYAGLALKDPPLPGANADQYSVSHCNWVYALDRAGNLRLIFPPELDLQSMTDDVRILLND